jgi:AraC-like DNA-binding protein
MKARPNVIQGEFYRQQPLAASVFQLFDQLPNACHYVKDTQSRFVHVNRATLRIYDLEYESEMLGKTDRDFHPPMLAEAYMAEDRRVFRTGRAILGQLWLVPHIRGTPQWFVSSKTPLFTPAGEVIGLAGVMFKVERPRETDQYLGRLKPALDYLETHYSADVSFAAAAARCGLPATTFNRQFRALLRMTPTEYLLTWRVEAARQMLVGTDHILAEIAADCGFADQSHFTKRFKRITGLTPLAYRRQFARQPAVYLRTDRRSRGNLTRQHRVAGL